MSWENIDGYEQGWNTLEEARAMLEQCKALGDEEDRDVFIIGKHASDECWDNDLDGCTHFAITNESGEWILMPGEPDDDFNDPAPSGWHWHYVA
jgi:hypothetical protein